MLCVLILIPPSETKRPGGEGVLDLSALSHPELLSAREGVLDALSITLAHDDASHRLRMEKGVALRALTLDESLHSSPTLPALERYEGVLYSFLDFSSLPPETRSTSDLAVLSPLWGLLSPPDRIPEYRLKLSSRLEGLPSLAAHWRSHLAGSLPELVVDLLPKEYSRALPRALSSTVRLDFASRTASYDAKAARGALARRILLTGLEAALADPDLQGWEHVTTREEGSVRTLVLQRIDEPLRG